MILLSIDVGIRNLGMCLMDTSTKKIRHWDATGIPPQHESGLFVCLRNHLRDRPWVLESSKVLIEKQPDKNKTMKSVENFIHAYFLCNDKDVQIYDARFKIPDVVGPGRAMYLQRKKASVDRCTQFLEEHNPEWSQWFLAQKKKDDLADSVMQALSYSVPPVTLAKEKKKSPRKPTVNQSDTRYSRANLAWLHVNGIPSEKRKRFDKDLKRYYTSVQEMLRDFNIEDVERLSH
jgi:hypothetical protein